MFVAKIYSDKINKLKEVAFSAADFFKDGAKVTAKVTVRLVLLAMGAVTSANASGISFNDLLEHLNNKNNARVDHQKHYRPVGRMKLDRTAKTKDYFLKKNLEDRVYINLLDLVREKFRENPNLNETTFTYKDKNDKTKKMTVTRKMLENEKNYPDLIKLQEEFPLKGEHAHSDFDSGSEPKTQADNILEFYETRYYQPNNFEVTGMGGFDTQPDAKGQNPSLFNGLRAGGALKAAAGIIPGLDGRLELAAISDVNNINTPFSAKTKSNQQVSDSKKEASTFSNVELAGSIAGQFEIGNFSNVVEYTAMGRLPNQKDERITSEKWTGFTNYWNQVRALSQYQPKNTFFTAIGLGIFGSTSHDAFTGATERDFAFGGKIDNLFFDKPWLHYELFVYLDYHYNSAIANLEDKNLIPKMGNWGWQLGGQMAFDSAAFNIKKWYALVLTNILFPAHSLTDAVYAGEFRYYIRPGFENENNAFDITTRVVKSFDFGTVQAGMAYRSINTTEGVGANEMQIKASVGIRIGGDGKPLFGGK